MIAWRITKTRHDPLDPTGARLHGARWNSPGSAVLYAADSYAGALLEILVHAARPRTLPGPHHAVRFEIPDDALTVLDPALVEGWERPQSEVARSAGDAWIKEGSTLGLSVPSLPARPVGRNLLLLPDHPEWPRVTVSDPRPVPWDERVFR